MFIGFRAPAEVCRQVLQFAGAWFGLTRWSWEHRGAPSVVLAYVQSLSKACVCVFVPKIWEDPHTLVKPHARKPT